MYNSEILPSSGVGVVVAFQWIVSGLIGVLIPILKDAIGIEAIFFSCSLLVVVGMLILNVMGEETLGKTKQEIDEAFSSKKDSVSTPKQRQIPKNTTEIA